MGDRPLACPPKRRARGTDITSSISKLGVDFPSRSILRQSEKLGVCRDQRLCLCRLSCFLESSGCVFCGQAHSTTCKTRRPLGAGADRNFRPASRIFKQSKPPPAVARSDGGIEVGGWFEASDVGE